MFRRVLVANRGEIAVRIVRALRELNIESVVIYSEADRESLAAMMANKSVLIGPTNVEDSYLNMEAIIETAIKTGCDAIHPGYGFLSENANFAKKCDDNGIVFIGPSSETIEKMGNKQMARQLMSKENIPIVPGSNKIIKSEEEAVKVADNLGYPILIKASAGGGGKGMRKVFCADELLNAFKTAKSESKAAFGNDDVYFEKYILNPHHIEVQIISDKQGNVIHLGERECSIQKNNQKILEESPSPFISEQIRNEMEHTAIKVAQTVNYDSVGTVEFIVDDTGKFYFIEMNTRIQVEHPVSEMVFRVDIIKEQINIACGNKLSIKQNDVHLIGHSIECRINALWPGKIKYLHFPDGYGIRVDSHIFEEYEVSPHYDSMLAKIIVIGKTRDEAISKMRSALEELIIEGVSTNLKVVYAALYNNDFISGNYNTGFYEEFLKETELQ